MSGKRWAILGVAAVLALGVMVGVRVMSNDGEPRFCNAGLAIGQTADGTTYPLEDQGSPGRDGCDRTDWPDGPVFGPGYIGYDCKLHGTLDTPGTVMAPGPDGECGL